MFLNFIGNPIKVVILICITIISCSFFSSNDSDFSSTENYNYINRNTNQLISILDKSVLLADSVFAEKKLSQLRANYFIARRYYKHIECFLEYTSPFDVKYFINGPLVKKSDLEIGTRIVDPHGFQVIEEQLFGVDSIDISVLVSELNLLRDSFKGFKNKLKTININDSQIIEMMQFELIRMSSLNLSGYDASFTKTNSNECINVFVGFRSLIEGIKKNNLTKAYPVELHLKLISKLILAEKYCSVNRNYDSFNRLVFITQHIKPIYKLLVKIHQTNIFPYTKVDYAINLNSDHVFEKESYNINYFSVHTIDTFGLASQAKLGELLFFDPVLSGNNERACASCHKPDLAFSDGLEKGISYEKNKLDRNTPSLLNTIFQKNFFMMVELVS